MVKALRVAVVGYGTGGQASALMLTADGHHVDVFERAPVLGPVGAGFLLQPVGLAVLWELGLLEDVLMHGAPISRLYGETSRGRAVMDMRYRDLDVRLFGLGLQRGALFSLLDASWRDGRSVRRGCHIVGIDADKGMLTDASGQHYDGYDLVIIADGAASQLRHQITKPRLDRPYPWGAQWCLVEQGQWPWTNELRQRYVRARRMIGMLPVGTRPDDPTPRLSFFWSLPAASLEVSANEENLWRKDVAAVWPEAAEWLQATDVPAGLAAARYRDTVSHAWHRGRAVLLGDSAHAMSPQLGQGVNMALLDARALRDALRAASSASQALAAYQRERKQHIGIYHFWSRWLTPLFQSDHDHIAVMRDLAFHPMSRLPGSRAQMLRILTGTQRGWWGRHVLPPRFLRVLGADAV